MTIRERSATKVVVASTVMLSFISFWRAAAIVLNDLGSSAYYVPGIAEQADYGDQTDYLRVFITHLRKKIEPDPAKPQYILTEPWIGYRFASSTE